MVQAMIVPFLIAPDLSFFPFYFFFSGKFTRSLADCAHARCASVQCKCDFLVRIEMNTLCSLLQLIFWA